MDTYKLLRVVLTLNVVFLCGVTVSIADENDEKKVLYWVAPMDPNFKRDKPGKSPMGLSLIHI